jgi:ParB family chromosome partitioning protein
MQKNTLTRKFGPSGTKRKKSALGKGLDALIPGFSTEDESNKEFFLCDVDRIHPNRYQPRRHFPADDLAELAASIKAQGVLQPLLVREHADGFELIAGERRLRAAKQAGLSQVPVVVKQISDTEMLEMSIVENIQRENLNPMEEAEAYHRLITEFNLTQDQAAIRVGKSRSAVANFLRLRQLPEAIKDSIFQDKLSMGHARALLGVETSAQQLAAWRKVMAQGLSVRETEKLIRRLKAEVKPSAPPAAAPSEDRYFLDMADDLARYFGTKVQIHRKGKRGRVIIEFFSDDDLDRLIQLLKRR